jgi:hypothetical protein
MSSLSYLGSKLAPICMVLAGFPTSICTALAFLSILKTPDIRGMARLSGVVGTRRLSSLSLAVATAVVANSMPSCSQSSAHYILASSMMALAGPSILSLR